MHRPADWPSSLLTPGYPSHIALFAEVSEHNWTQPLLLLMLKRLIVDSIFSSCHHYCGVRTAGFFQAHCAQSKTTALSAIFSDDCSAPTARVTESVLICAAIFVTRPPLKWCQTTASKANGGLPVAFFFMHTGSVILCPSCGPLISFTAFGFCLFYLFIYCLQSVDSQSLLLDTAADTQISPVGCWTELKEELVSLISRIACWKEDTLLFTRFRCWSTVWNVDHTPTSRLQPPPFLSFLFPQVTERMVWSFLTRLSYLECSPTIYRIPAAPHRAFRGQEVMWLEAKGLWDWKSILSWGNNWLQYFCLHATHWYVMYYIVLIKKRYKNLNTLRWRCFGVDAFFEADNSESS